jgi:UDP-glucuronate 4-epimerase
LLDTANKILLTGGAGFIGSHLAESLLRLGAQLTIVDNLEPFYSPQWKRANLACIRAAGEFTFRETDICDLRRLRSAFESSRPRIVIHLAARAGVRPSIEDPIAYERTNVNGTMNVLELCREFRVHRLIFGSSSSVYGATTNTPFSESQIELRPISPYAATKLAGELLCSTYADLHSLPVVSLRLFTAYGPRQRPDLAIHKFTALIEAGLPVPVFGDGSTGRDYTWVEDIVAGIRAAVRVPLPPIGAPYSVYNLGNSHPVPLTDLISLLEEATGREAKREFLPPQPGDVPLTWADISKSRRELDFRPSISLEDGLKTFVEWYRASPGRRAQTLSRAVSGRN